MPSLVDAETTAAGESAAAATATTTEGGADSQDVAMSDADGATASAVATATDTAESETNEDITIPVATIVPPTTSSTGNSSTAAVATGGKSLGKQAKKSSRTASPITNNNNNGEASASQAIAAANLAAAVQMAASLQLNGLLSLLTQSSTPGSASAADPTVLQTSSLFAVSSASLSSSNAAWQVPTPDQVRQAALKAVQDAPPLVHLSKTDSAPQLKILDADRLTLKGGMRGYRMSRATHGVSQGHYYFEVVVLDAPKVSEIVTALPPNARLGPSLQKQIQQALEYAKQHPQQQQQSSSATDAQASSSEPKTEDATTTSITEDGTAAAEDSTHKPGRKRKTETEAGDTNNKKAKTGAAAITGPPQVGGHLRIGWSMRTGDLQAPVGYDKWSYGFRSIGGSKSHQSRRDDGWGGESWGPGDVVGCSISLVTGNSPNTAANANAASTATTEMATKGNNSNNTNEIRFFKNGVNMGHFVISKGKREGGVAFDDIQPGTYYPAISSYLGGAVQVNFGPHFVYPPRKLPHGMNANQFQPMSSLQPPPLSEDEIVARLKKKTIFSKVHPKEKDPPETKMAAFKEAVLAESRVLHEAHQKHTQKHLQFVLQARKARNLATAEIEQELEELERSMGSGIGEAMDEDGTAKTETEDEPAKAAEDA